MEPSNTYGSLSGGGGGVVFPEKLGGGVRPTSQNPTLFMTKIPTLFMT